MFNARQRVGVIGLPLYVVGSSPTAVRSDTCSIAQLVEQKTQAPSSTIYPLSRATTTTRDVRMKLLSKRERLVLQRGLTALNDPQTACDIMRAAHMALGFKAPNVEPLHNIPYGYGQGLSDNDACARRVQSGG